MWGWLTLILLCPRPPRKMLKISVITLFPDIFQSHLQHLPISRAVEKKLLQIDFIDLHDFAIDKRGTVDSSPYGGGPGMVLRPEPIFDAINFALDRIEEEGVPQPSRSGSRTSPPTPANVCGTSLIPSIIFLTPRGKTYNQAAALKLSTAKNLIIMCGRYEGLDQRVVEYFHAQEISIGNYVLSGGEVAAMAMIESITRLIPSAIENQEALANESFNDGRVEHPQYSRPEEWKGLKVPAELLSGHHENVKKWKVANSNSTS